MPVPGGPSDKAGNSFERRWTVLALCDLLEGTSESIRIEVPGDLGAGAEFVVMANGTQTWHQAKRQRDSGAWSINALAKEGVLQPWWPKIGVGDRCLFVSGTSAQELSELVDRAKRAESWTEFSDEFLKAEAQRERFRRLRSAWDDPPEEATYEALASIDVSTVDETVLARLVEAKLASLVTGKPSVAAAVLGQLVGDSTHLKLTASEVWDRLEENGIAPRGLSLDGALLSRLKGTVDTWLSRLGRTYIGGEEIRRHEAGEAFAALADCKRVLISGGSGSGKSVITGQVAEHCQDAGWTILALSVDRLPDAATTNVLGGLLGLPDSPVTVLAGCAGGGEALLILDQLDAVSVASGRNPERLGIVQDLLAEAQSHPKLHVLVACRRFDLDHDRELRLAASDDLTTVVEVGGLDESDVRNILAKVGVETGQLTDLVELLTVPLHLAIYVELIRGGMSGIPSPGSLTELYNQYWHIKRQVCREARSGSDDWPMLVDRMVEYMSAHQSLSCPTALVDDFDEQVAAMASASVLVKESDLLSFFHETFFDYCFARRFLAKGLTLRELLKEEEQDLFRRAQVRQILSYERASDRQSYLLDLEWLLTSTDVRLHIKALVVALAQTIADPQQDEWLILRPVALDATSQLHDRLWRGIRGNPSWFPILNAADEWSSWLASTNREVRSLAIWALSGMSSSYPDEIAQLLRGVPADLLRDHLRTFLYVADVSAGRPLFELFLEAVESGGYDDEQSRDFWYVLRTLSSRRPEWAIEALSTLIQRALDAGAVNPFERDGLVGSKREFLADETVRQLAKSAPRAFVDALLGLVMEIAHRNARPEWSEGDAILDAVWGLHLYGDGVSIGDDVFAGMQEALQWLAREDPSHAEGWFELLRTDAHESSWFLLARAYTASPERFAGDAANWLTNTPGALGLGYSDAPHWVSRELIEATTRECDDEQLDRLVDALMHYTPPWERDYDARLRRGFGEFCLLNAVEPSRRPARAVRRLEELRRKFMVDDAPPPQGITAGVVPAPIKEDVARRMSDDQWLRAMARYGSTGSTFVNGKFVGDAGTQAGVLEALTREDPVRFAHLLLKMPAEVAEVYVSGIIRGLTGAGLDPPLLVLVCQGARKLGNEETDRWIARLIESEAASTLPEQILELLVDIAGGTEPREDEGDPDAHGLNSLRGASASAIGALIVADYSRLPFLVAALTRLAADPVAGVRAMVARALTGVLPIDSALALELFAVLEALDDKVLESRYVEYFLNSAIRRGHYLAVAGVVRRMTTSESEPVRRAGARQLAVASYLDAELDKQVDALFADEASREAIVGVFADNVMTSTRRDRAFDVLARAFDDSSEAVRASASRSFYRLESVPLSDYESLLMAFGKSAALLDDSSVVFHVLAASRHPLPPVVLELCERVIDLHGESLGDLAQASAGNGSYLAHLVIRIRAQHNAPEMRQRCLDLIDRLIAVGAHGIDERLAEVER